MEIETGKQYKLHLVNFNIEILCTLESITWNRFDNVVFNFSCSLFGTELSAYIDLRDLYRYHVERVYEEGSIDSDD